MISRHWGAVVKRERASDYIAHLQSETFPAIRKIAGFVDATIQRRDAPDGVEFLIVTRWHSMAAISQFAGSDPEQSVVPEKARAMMISFEARVRHYEVV